MKSRHLFPVLATVLVAFVAFAPSASARVYEGSVPNPPAAFSTTWNSKYATTRAYLDDAYGSWTPSARSYVFYSSGVGGGFNWVRTELRVYRNGALVSSANCAAWSCAGSSRARDGAQFEARARFCADYKDDGSSSKCTGWSVVSRS